jgi:outer membrane biosynthesis protein TonB
MSTTLSPLAFELVLPWHLNEERERAFYSTLKKVLIPIIILFLLLPWLEQIDTGKAPPLAKPIITTRVILEPKKPVAKPVQPTPAEPTEFVPLESPIVIQPPKDLPKPPSMTKETAGSKKGPKGKDQGKAALAPVEDTKTALVKSQALSELSNQLRSLRGSIDIAKMQNKNVSNSTGGTVAASNTEVLGAERAEKRGSGRGLAVNERTMRGDIVGLADHISTSVDGVPGGTGGGGNGGNSPNGGNFSRLSGQGGRRDMESIRATLEAAKSSVYSLYQRALLDHPDLAGKFTFSIVIQPNGSISDLKVVASELGLKELENSILARIKQINFGAKEVSATALEYKFVFLPS